MARYIDANYLFKCQTCRHFDGDECDTFCDSYECYSPDMSKIPTADVVEVKHRRWEEIRNAFGELEGWLCECGREVKSRDNYCPNCGAKMDEKKVK